MSDYTDYLSFVHSLADASGDVLRRYFRAGVAIDTKSDDTPVTIADRKAESVIRALIEAEYPTHGILGEEHGSIRTDADYVWVLDPIDGTKSFITGKPLFTTLIALMHNGKPVLGLIDQPIMRERWMGGTNMPSNFNNMPIKTSTCASLQDAYLTATSPHMFDPREKVIFDELRIGCKNVNYGNDAYGYALLAHGTIDLVVEANMQPHDYMALIPVIENAGGVITDWQGDALALKGNGRVLAAANAALHAQALDILGKVA